MRGRGRTPAPVGMAVTGTLVVHGLVIVLLFGTPSGRARLPPTYRVRLIAAPAADLEARKAPEAFERPAEEKPAPIPAAKRPQSTVSRAPPPPTQDQTRREAAPRTVLCGRLAAGMKNRRRATMWRPSARRASHSRSPSTCRTSSHRC